MKNMNFTRASCTSPEAFGEIKLGSSVNMECVNATHFTTPGNAKSDSNVSSGGNNNLNTLNHMEISKVL